MAKKMFFYNGTILFDPQCSGGDESKNYGYSQSVLTFMRNVGSGITKGGEWAFLLNIANDYEVTKDTEKNTIAAGLREYVYFQPTSHPKPWTEMNRKHVIDYLNSDKRVKGKLIVYTTALCTTGGVHEKFDKQKRIENEGHDEVFDCNDREKLVGQENSSARATIRDLNALANYVSGYIDEPVFAACDCNCFHNSAFVLGLSALRRAIDAERMVIDPSVLIVNFDQHYDYDAEEGTVKSDGWGQPIRRMIPSATYLSIGCTGGIGLNNSTTTFGVIPGEKTISKLDAFKNREDIKITREDLLRCKSAGREDNVLKGKFKALWSALASRACKLRRSEDNTVKQTARFRHYYITIDRDCMMYNYNQWGHQGAIFQDPKHVRDLVGLIGDTLREHGAKLAGLDVTGLPESFFLKTTNFDSKSRVYDDSNEDRVDTPCGVMKKRQDHAKKTGEKAPGKPPIKFQYGYPRMVAKPKKPAEKGKDETEEHYQKRLDNNRRMKEEWDGYVQNKRLWEEGQLKGKLGGKREYDSALETRQQQVKAFKEYKVKNPTPECNGFCPKCQGKIVPNLKVEIEELYKLFNDLIKKQEG